MVQISTSSSASLIIIIIVVVVLIIISEQVAGQTTTTSAPIDFVLDGIGSTPVVKTDAGTIHRGGACVDETKNALFAFSQSKVDALTGYAITRFSILANGELNATGTGFIKGTVIKSAFAALCPGNGAVLFGGEQPYKFYLYDADTLAELDSIAVTLQPSAACMFPGDANNAIVSTYAGSAANEIITISWNATTLEQTSKLSLPGRTKCTGIFIAGSSSIAYVACNADIIKLGLDAKKVVDIESVVAPGSSGFQGVAPHPSSDCRVLSVTVGGAVYESDFCEANGTAGRASLFLSGQGCRNAYSIISDKAGFVIVTCEKNFPASNGKIIAVTVPADNVSPLSVPANGDYTFDVKALPACFAPMPSGGPLYVLGLDVSTGGKLSYVLQLAGHQPVIKPPSKKLVVGGDVKLLSGELAVFGMCASSSLIFVIARANPVCKLVVYDLNLNRLAAVDAVRGTDTESCYQCVYDSAKDRVVSATYTNPAKLISWGASAPFAAQAILQLSEANANVLAIDDTWFFVGFDSQTAAKVLKVEIGTFAVVPGDAPTGGLLDPGTLNTAITGLCVDDVTAGNYMYATMRATNPGRIAKIRRSPQFSAMATIPIGAGNNWPSGGAVLGEYFYTSLVMSPGKVCRVKIADIGPSAVVNCIAGDAPSFSAAPLFTPLTGNILYQFSGTSNQVVAVDTKEFSTFDPTLNSTFGTSSGNIKYAIYVGESVYAGDMKLGKAGLYRFCIGICPATTTTSAPSTTTAAATTTTSSTSSSSSSSPSTTSTAAAAGAIRYVGQQVDFNATTIDSECICVNDETGDVFLHVTKRNPPGDGSSSIMKFTSDLAFVAEGYGFLPSIAYALCDSTNGIVLGVAATSPAGQLVSYDMASLAWNSPTVFPSDGQHSTARGIAEDSEFYYCGFHSPQPSTVARVRKSGGRAHNGTVALGSGNDMLMALVAHGDFLFAVCFSPGRIAKVQLSSFKYVSAIVATTSSLISASIFDGHLYVAANTQPGAICRVELEAFEFSFGGMKCKQHSALESFLARPVDGGGDFVWQVPFGANPLQFAVLNKSSFAYAPALEASFGTSGKWGNDYFEREGRAVAVRGRSLYVQLDKTSISGQSQIMKFELPSVSGGTTAAAHSTTTAASSSASVSSTMAQASTAAATTITTGTAAAEKNTTAASPSPSSSSSSPPANTTTSIAPPPTTSLLERSTSVSATAANDERPAPIEGEMSVAATTAVGATAAAIAAMTSPAAPAVAALAARSLALPAVATCSGRNGDGELWLVSWPAFPLTLFPGSVVIGEAASGGRIRAAMVSLFVGLLVAVCVGIGASMAVNKRPFSPLALRAVMVAMGLLLQGIGEASGILSLAGGGSADIAGAVLPIIIILGTLAAGAAFLHFATRPGGNSAAFFAYVPSVVEPKDAEADNHSEAIRGFLDSRVGRFLLIGHHQWAGEHGALAILRKFRGEDFEDLDEEVEGETAAAAAAGGGGSKASTLQKLRARVGIFTFIIVLFLSMLAAILTGVAKADPTKCPTALALLAVCNVILFLYDLLIHPSIVPARQIIFTSVNFLIAVVSILAAAHLGSPEAARANPGVVRFINLGTSVAVLLAVCAAAFFLGMSMLLQLLGKVTVVPDHVLLKKAETLHKRMLVHYSQQQRRRRGSAQQQQFDGAAHLDDFEEELLEQEPSPVVAVEVGEEYDDDDDDDDEPQALQQLQHRPQRRHSSGGGGGGRSAVVSRVGGGTTPELLITPRRYTTPREATSQRTPREHSSRNQHQQQQQQQSRQRSSPRRESSSPRPHRSGEQHREQQRPPHSSHREEGNDRRRDQQQHQRGDRPAPSSSSRRRGHEYDDDHHRRDERGPRHTHRVSSRTHASSSSPHGRDRRRFDDSKEEEHSPRREVSSPRRHHHDGDDRRRRRDDNDKARRAQQQPTTPRSARPSSSPRQRRRADDDDEGNDEERRQSPARERRREQEQGEPRGRVRGREHRQSSRNGKY